VKRLTLVLVTHGAGRARNWSISYPLVWLSVILFLAFLSVFGFFFRSYYTKTVDKYTLSRLRAENVLLRERLTAFERKLDQLSSTMMQLVESDTRLRVMANLETIDEDVRKLGVGGSLPNEEELREVNPAVAEEVESVSSNLDELIRQTELQFRSFQEIKSHLEKANDLRDHTPSIRPCAGWMVSGFGYRKDPFTRTRKFHEGLDIGAPVGTPVYATADGTVESIKYYTRGYGLTVVLDHGYGYKTVYAHLSISKVKRYQRVSRGEVIGLVGNSGKSTGPHLHYEVRVTGQARNPLTYIIPDEKYFH